MARKAAAGKAEKAATPKKATRLLRQELAAQDKPMRENYNTPKWRLPESYNPLPTAPWEIKKQSDTQRAPQRRALPEKPKPRR